MAGAEYDVLVVGDLNPDLVLTGDVAPAFGQAEKLVDDASLTTSLDTNFDPALRWDGGLDEALRHTDVFLPNEVEAAAISGRSEPHAALEALARRVPTVALKLGPAGGLAQQGMETASAPALPGAVVDTTGAGDSFDAGFLRGWLDGWPLERCLRLACACGSLSTRTAGGTSGQPSLAEAREAAGL